MNSKFRLCIVLVSSWVFLQLNSCGTDRDPGDLLVPQSIGTLVVSGLLTVGEPFPAILLSRTALPTRAFDFSSSIVADAVDFHIEFETTTKGRDQVGYRFEGSHYVPEPDDIGRIVQPDTRYRLIVETPRDERLSAETLTPPAFAVNDWVLLTDDGNNVDRRLESYVAVGEQVYEENELVHSGGFLEGQFTRPDVPGFQVGIESLDLDSDYAIDPDFFDEEDFENLDRIGSSPPLITEDGLIRLPWFAIYFQGRYKIRFFAMDRNWFDLARSLPDFGGSPGFGGQAGDSFERPIFHIEGGIGLFGSAAVDSIGFFVLPEKP